MSNQDEYEFNDLEAFDSTSPEETESPPPSQMAEPAKSPISEVWRNVLTVVVFIVISMVIYKFVASFFHKKTKTTTVTQVTTMVEPTKVASFEQHPVVQTQPLVEVNKPDADTLQKLAAVTINQESMHSEVNQLTTQVTSVSNNLDALNEKINQLNQTIVGLTDKLAVESHRVEELLVAKAKARVRRVHVVRSMIPQMNYFLQAVIPGRAWLIATNGSTLTVRVGTRIANYGAVTRIDANQGRVLTSSGRVIKFSPEDS